MSPTKLFAPVHGLTRPCGVINNIFFIFFWRYILPVLYIAFLFPINAGDKSNP